MWYSSVSEGQGLRGLVCHKVWPALSVPYPWFAPAALGIDMLMGRGEQVVLVTDFRCMLMSVCLLHTCAAVQPLDRPADHLICLRTKDHIHFLIHCALKH